MSAPISTTSRGATAALLPTDLVLFVWPRSKSAHVEQRSIARHDVADAEWAISRAKADRVRVIVSVSGDTIIGAWSVIGCVNALAAPKGTTRLINRARFEMEDDPRLRYLVGQRSQVPRRRNPQTTIELYDLTGSRALLSEPDAIDAGVVRVGEYTLIVHPDGSAELQYPADSSLLLRPGPWLDTTGSPSGSPTGR